MMSCHVQRKEFSFVGNSMGKGPDIETDEEIQVSDEL